MTHKPVRKPGVPSTCRPSRPAIAFLSVIAFSLLGPSAAPAVAGPAEADPAALRFFEMSIRPLLAERCYRCHGPVRQDGGLRFDSRAALLHGGDGGPAIFTDRPAESPLLQALTTDPPAADPPEHRVSKDDMAALSRWIQQGAPWPDDRADPEQSRRRSSAEVTEADRSYWAFRPLHRPAVPDVENPAWAANPIDAFILARLRAAGLAPSRPAGRRELVRRACFDLLGLPPTPAQIDAFVLDGSPDAWSKLIDRLLARPQYGERWGRHWLDVVRFAQSNGYERDAEKPFAWRYRDYIIRAFNADKPYDRFVREQLAGDELEPVTRDSIIATGFYRLGVWDDEPDDARAAEYDYLDDILATTGAAFMGLTVGCARCHDHMFDPIPQRDYYELLAFFRNVRFHEKPKFTLNSATFLPLAADPQIERWRRAQQQRLEPLRARLEAAEDDGEKKKLREQIERIEQRRAPFDWALAVTERDPEPIETRLLVRGDAANPDEAVEPRFLDALGGGRPDPPESPPHGRTTGRRRAFARWLTNPDAPAGALTARVMVNRIWQHHFGRGLAPTPNDFGRAGLPPTHADLLDWLAAEFIASGWSVKHMHRLIMGSAAYRMSSRADNPSAIAADPDNELLWRQSMRRLEAEALRDAVLAAAGSLNLEMGGRGFFPRLSGEVVAGASRPGHGWDASPPSQRRRRSVYIFIKRTLPAPTLETFDYANTASPLGVRPTTTVAPQALLLLNSRFMNEQAAAFAERLIEEAGDDEARRIDRAYRLALGRRPTPRETDIALEYLRRQREAFERIDAQLAFRPDAPPSLDRAYHQRLDPADLLLGPRDGWTYHKGIWGGGYEGILTAEPRQAPFALWTGIAFADGAVEGRFRLDHASELGGLILRGRAEGEALRGYSILFNARRDTVLLLRHEGERATPIATAAADLQTGVWRHLRIDAAGPRIRLRLGGAETPLLDARDGQPLTEPGFLGAQAWGGGLTLDGLTVHTGDRAVPVAYGDEARRAEVRRRRARRRALESFCLLVLNLNEFAYVD